MPLQRLRKVKTPYAILLNRVRNTLINAQQHIEEAKVRTYWETGQHIHRHILRYSNRADYGGEILKKLSADLNVDKSTLYSCVKFAKAYPVMPIFRARGKFKWAHFRELVSISDDNVRRRLEEGIKRNAWTTDELRARIKSERGRSANTIQRGTSASNSQIAPRDWLKPLCGQAFTYMIVERPDLSHGEHGLLLDLGFGIFHNLEKRVISQFKAGDIVQSTPKDDAYQFRRKDGGSVKDLYTFQAYVERVIDGDTLKVWVDLGFDTFKHETLRLRGINTPEMPTKDGVAAKTFVQSYLKEADRIIVHSTRDDKYGRYLADIFIPKIDGDIYLNNLLLEQGIAVRM